MIFRPMIAIHQGNHALFVYYMQNACQRSPAQISMKTATHAMFFKLWSKIHLSLMHLILVKTTCLGSTCVLYGQYIEFVASGGEVHGVTRP